MDKSVPKEAVVKLYGGDMIELFTSTNDTDDLANRILPKYGRHAHHSGRHLLAVSPVYKLEEVYLYIKGLFE